MIRVEIELSVSGEPLAYVAESIAHALDKEERLNDAVIHRLTVEEEEDA